MAIYLKCETFKILIEVIVSDLKANGIAYSTTNTVMTAVIQNELEQIKHRINSGRIKIAVTHADTRKLPGLPQNIQAKDN